MFFSEFIYYYYGYHLLIELNQFDLIKKAKEENSIISYILILPCGIKEYINRSLCLLRSYKEKTKREINNISKPYCIKIDYLDEHFIKYEKKGIENINKCGFVLVAGGLGERLNCSYLKISMPVDQISEYSYLKLYFRYILSYENIMKSNIFICIMTSPNNNKMINHYLEESNFFGLKKNQISIVQQINLPSFCDSEGNISYLNGRIASKPHGHGDIHSLLYNNRILEKWNNKGVQYVIIFQDTNSLAFEAVPALLGCTIYENADVNYLTTERYEGEKASILCSCEENNVIYNIRAIDYSLLPQLLGENINRCMKKKSSYPAVTNIICFKLYEYFETLKQNKGLPEYILSNNNNKSFRLETVLQDYLILANNSSRNISLYIPRWLCFNPVKNISSESDIYTPDSGERNMYYKNIIKLKTLGYNISDNAIIYLDPIISSTTYTLKKHFEGSIAIENNSKLILHGNIFVKNLHLDGSLTIRVREGGSLIINNLSIKNKGYTIIKKIKNVFNSEIKNREELVMEFGFKSYIINDFTN